VFAILSGNHTYYPVKEMAKLVPIVFVSFCALEFQEIIL